GPAFEIRGRLSVVLGGCIAALETCQSGRMDFTANEGSGLNSTGGSNPPVSASTPPGNRGSFCVSGCYRCGTEPAGQCVLQPGLRPVSGPRHVPVGPDEDGLGSADRTNHRKLPPAVVRGVH